jgi:hypothetical protein
MFVSLRSVVARVLALVHLRGDAWTPPLAAAPQTVSHSLATSVGSPIRSKLAYAGA